MGVALDGLGGLPIPAGDGGTIRRLDPCDGPGPANVRTFELLPVMYPGDDKAGQ